jgi:hypothetical protein
MRIMRPGMRGVAAATALVAVAAGLSAQPASATPQVSTPALAALADDPLPEATPDEKYRAALLVGAGDDLNMQSLPDCDFVHEIAVHPNAGPEVRKDAVAAFGSGTVSDGDPAYCTAFIREGVFAANLRDQANEQYQRAERDARQAAAASIGMAVTPRLLAMTNYEFVAQVMSYAEPDTLVHKGADAAIASNDAEQLRTFITAGIFTAHHQDVIDAIQRDKDKTEAEKEAAVWKATKVKALAWIGVVATEEMLVLDDTNFIYLISTKATAGSEVQFAALEALDSFDAEIRRIFIKEGVETANALDLAKERQKQAEENRTEARRIRAEAANSLVHPALVAAADTALAGSDSDVLRFLMDGRHKAVTQTLRTTTPGRVGWYLRASSASATIAAQGATTGAALTDATWKVVQGLGDSTCHSLESTTSPGYYLSEVGNAVKLTANDGSATFKTAATWCASVGKSGSNVSLQSKSKPGRFLRHFGTELWTAANTTSYDFDRGCGFDQNTTWRFDVPGSPALADDGPGEACADLATATYSSELLIHSDPGRVRYQSMADNKVSDVSWRYFFPRSVTPWGVMGEVAGGDLDGVKYESCIPNPTCIILPASLQEDLIAIERTTGKLWMYPNLPRSGTNPRIEIGTGGWNGMRELMIGKFCLTATSVNGNVVAVERSTGKLWCYTRNNSANTMSRKEIGSGWNGYDRLTAGDFGAGDANASDILAVERATGTLWMYPSKVGGGFHTRIQVNANFSAYVNLVAGNFNGSGADDLIATDKNGVMYFWPGTGSGKFGARVTVS